MPLIERRIDDRLVLIGEWFRKAKFEHPDQSIEVLLYFPAEMTWRAKTLLVGNLWNWLYTTIVPEDFSVSVSSFPTPVALTGLESLNVSFNEPIADVSSIELLPEYAKS